MKKHKVVLDHTTQVYEYGFNKVNLTIFLNDNELKELIRCMRNNRDSGTMALYHFTHSDACTKHHKYLIWKTFGSGEINITIK